MGPWPVPGEAGPSPGLRCADAAARRQAYGAASPRASGPCRWPDVIEIATAMAGWGWAFGLAAALEAFFLTGVVFPGTLIVVAGGILAETGVFGAFGLGPLLAWVVLGSLAGAEASYWTGRLLAGRMSGRLPRLRAPGPWPAQARARALVRRRGGLALVVGRIFAANGGLVPLVAAEEGMAWRRFAPWSLAGAAVSGAAHLVAGAALGRVLTWAGPSLPRIVLILGALVLTLILTLGLVLRLVRLVPQLLRLVAVMAAVLADTPPLRRLIDRHPRALAALAARFARDRFTGLPLTALAAIFAYGLTVWLQGAAAFLAQAPIVAVDARLAELTRVFWTPGLLRLAAHVTALGDVRVVTPLVLAALVWLAMRRQGALMAGLALSALGDPVTVDLLKQAFQRPRPDLAYFVKHSNSFPSGHAAIALAFYGTLAHALWRCGRLGPAAAAGLATVLALAIGLSRIYLIEHYLSDVLNGWLVGGLWMVAGITLGEWLRARPERAGPATMPRLSPRMRGFGWALVLALVFAAGWTTARYDKALAIPPAPAGPIRVADAAALFDLAARPRFTESLLGSPLEPINLVLIARDEAGLRAAMARAGWSPARLPSPAALGQAIWSLITNHPDPVAPVTPYFWNGAPNGLAFERSAAATGGPRQRHHVRIWPAGAVLPDGRALYVAAASFDNGLDRDLLHHIAPDIDRERATLAQDLTAAGAVALAPIQGAGPAVGRSVAGDPWYSDGQAAVLALDPPG